MIPEVYDTEKIQRVVPVYIETLKEIYGSYSEIARQCKLSLSEVSRLARKLRTPKTNTLLALTRLQPDVWKLLLKSIDVT